MKVNKPQINLLSRIANGLDKILVWISLALGTVLTLNMIIAVFFRTISSPIFWADELSLILFAWLTFLGGSLAVKRSELAAVTILLDRLSSKFKMLLLIVIELVVIFFAVLIGYYSFNWVSSPSVMNMLSPTLGIGMWITYLIVPFSMFCIIIFSIDKINLLIKDQIKPTGEASNL